MEFGCANIFRLIVSLFVCSAKARLHPHVNLFEEMLIIIVTKAFGLGTVSSSDATVPRG